MTAPCCYTDANGTSCNCRMRADATQEVERNAAISTAIRALHTDATRAALDRAKAEGMREAARLIPPAVSGAASIILAAADKLEGKS